MKTKQELVDDALALAVPHGIVYAMKWLADQFKDDSQRLAVLMKDIDGFVNVEGDRYDYACRIAWENGREIPTEDDEVNGFREMIDAAFGLHKHN